MKAGLNNQNILRFEKNILWPHPKVCLKMLDEVDTISTIQIRYVSFGMKKELKSANGTLSSSAKYNTNQRKILRKKIRSPEKV